MGLSGIVRCNNCGNVLALDVDKKEIKKAYSKMNAEQKEVVHYLVGSALDAPIEQTPPGNPQPSDNPRDGLPFK